MSGNHSSTTKTVGVIIPTYNAVALTLEAIASVQAQTHQDFSIVVVDDGSTAENQRRLSAEIAQQNDPRVTYVPLDQNGGVAQARNLGLSKTSARFVAFLDCDDLWLPEKLEKQLAFMAANQAGFSFTHYENQNTKAGTSFVRETLPKVSFQSLLRWNVVGNSTVILDRQKIDIPEIPNLRRRQDFALWLKILQTEDFGYGLLEVLTIRRILDDSLSANKAVAAYNTWKMYRHGIGLSAITSTYYFTCYLMTGVRRFLFK